MSPLPSSPDLSFEKKQAKVLLRAIRASEPGALARLRAHLPAAASHPDAVTLADAQFVVARERGFDSWPRLKAGIEAARPIAAQAELLLDAVREDKSGVAARLLAAHPDLRGFNIFTAAAAGAADAVAALLAEDRTQALAVHTREEWTPLAYACRTRVHLVSDRLAADVRRAAGLLMDAGAGANSGSAWFESDGRKMPIPALYHACMADHPALVALLLEHGANPNDCESTYHAAQHNRQACLEVLVAHGANISDRQAPYNNTPLYFLAGHHSDEDGRAEWFKGLVWLLEHGADPNVTSYDKAEAPLHALAASQPKLATVRQVLAHGADVNLRRADGRTAYALAVRHGNAAIAELLREHGAETSGLTTVEAFLGACLEADEPRARAMSAAHPDLIASLTTEDRAAVADAVRHGNVRALRLMVSLGFPIAAESSFAGTPLHEAAWQGRVDAVSVLVELGAPIDMRDRQFGSSPLGWAAHGSGQHAGREDDYLAVVERLIAAGADRAASINKWGEAPENMASRRVAARLKAWAQALI